MAEIQSMASCKKMFNLSRNKIFLRISSKKKKPHDNPTQHRSITTNPTKNDMSDTKIIHCVRHAQGYHNLNIANHALRDPKLTSYGEEQCRRLAKDFPSKGVDLIVASPIVRTLNTSLIGFEEVIKSKGLKVVAIPELQETSDLPCDTGSSPEDLAKVYEGKPVDLSRVKADWTDKQGKFAPTASAIEARAKEARQWLMARPEKEIVVVTHGRFTFLFQNVPTDSFQAASSTTLPKTGREIIVSLAPAGPTPNSAPTISTPMTPTLA